MKITKIEPILIALPQARRHPSALAGGTRADLGRYVIVRVETDEGITGLGEATVLLTWAGDHGRYFGESPGTTMHLIQDVLGPALADADPMAIELAHVKMNMAVKGYPYAKSAVDMALHDITGKALQVPVYQLLGGLVRRWIPITHSLGILEESELTTKATAAIGEGIRTIKLKIGLDARRDIRAVAAVREAIGPDIHLVVDANSGYQTPKLAIAALREMAAYDLHYAEQPVEGLDAMARVAHALDVSIMADESAWNSHDILDIIRLGAADYVSLYTTKPGGLLPAKKTAAVAEAGGLPCNVNGSAETGIGNAANLHLAASTPVISESIVIPITNIEGQEQTQVAGVFYKDDIITRPFTYADGALEVPDAPGLGVELDLDKVQKYRVA
jgi:muconate cycloisomerase